MCNYSLSIRLLSILMNLYISTIIIITIINSLAHPSLCGGGPVRPVMAVSLSRPHFVLLLSTIPFLILHTNTNQAPQTNKHALLSKLNANTIIFIITNDGCRTHFSLLFRVCLSNTAAAFASTSTVLLNLHFNTLSHASSHHQLTVPILFYS